MAACDRLDRARAAPAALVAVSLKMFLDHRQTVGWCRDIATVAKASRGVESGVIELIVLPSLASLAAASLALASSGVRLGAQNVSWEDRGPFTGETSPVTVKQLGCRYVEVGHAERKRLFAESADVIARKVEAITRNGMIPLLCVGEPTRDESAAGACVQQLDEAIGPAVAAGLVSDIVIAYEPEWAIGQRRAASLDHVRTVAAALRERLAQHPSIRRGRVIYGGSAGPGLAARLGAAVDGLFLGRFAHDPRAVRAVLAEMEVVHSPR